LGESWAPSTENTVPRDLDYTALEAAIKASIAHYEALVEADEFLKRCEALIELRREAIKKARELLVLVRKIGIGKAVRDLRYDRGKRKRKRKHVAT